MMGFWLLSSYFREMLWPLRSARGLKRSQDKNKEKVLKRLSDYGFYKNLSVSRWTDLPVLTKAKYLAHFSELNRAKISYDQAMEWGADPKKAPKEAPVIGLSTGTSGRRGAFIASKKEVGQWAGSILGKILGWQLFRPQRIAFVFRSNSELYQSLNFGWLHFQFYDLNGDLEKTAQRLHAFAPTVFFATPHFYSRYLRIRPKREISPRFILTGADVLEKKEKSDLSAYFARPVTEIYQATEGFLGLSCLAGQIHLNERDYIIERSFVSENRFYPIVTDVRRKSQAIIRFQMEDLLVTGDAPCVCGNPCFPISRIEGRADQVLTFFDSEKNPVEVYPDFLRNYFSSTNWFREDYQLRQAKTGELRFLSDEELSAEKGLEIRAGVEDHLRTLGVSELEFYVMGDQKLEARGGKRRRILKDEI